MKIDQAETNYTYDALHQLVSVDPPGPGASDTVHYAYDRAGNRVKSGLQNGSGQWTAPYQTYTYALAGSQTTHRLAEVRDAANVQLEAFSEYDANGNPKKWWHGGVERTLHWDTLGRLRTIESAGFQGHYVYDPFGRRIEKRESGVTTRYQFDGLDVVAEYSIGANGANALAATFVFGPGIDEPIKMRRGETLAAYHSDGLGSILAVSRVGSGASTDLRTYRYDAFGVVESTGSLPTPYSFTGRELDASGLYYHRARYYLPSIGRFLSPDPIGLEGGINAYAYVGNNPVNFTDPVGLISMTPKGFSNLGSPPPAPAFSTSWSGSSFDQGAASQPPHGADAFRPDAYEVSAAFGLGLLGGAKARFSGAGEFEGFGLFGGIGAAARVQGGGGAGGSASKQLPGVSEGSPPRFTFGSTFSASLVPTSPVSPTVGFDTELGSGRFSSAQVTGGVSVGLLPIMVCAPCVNVNFTRSETLALLRALSVPPELSLMAPDLVERNLGRE
jgi:RHS repeat-associated protein